YETDGALIRTDFDGNSIYIYNSILAGTHGSKGRVVSVRYNLDELVIHNSSMFDIENIAIRNGGTIIKRVEIDQATIYNVEDMVFRFGYAESVQVTNLMIQNAGLKGAPLGQSLELVDVDDIGAENFLFQNANIYTDEEQVANVTPPEYFSGTAYDFIVENVFTESIIEEPVTFASLEHGTFNLSYDDSHESYSSSSHSGLPLGDLNWHWKEFSFEDYELTSVEMADTPREFGIEQNYPNPFNPTTTINYDIPEATNVSIKVYDITGREVAELVNAKKSAGSHTVDWNAEQFATGVYLYRITAGDFTAVRKLTLIK
ncbi:MAG: T9SS type A sorting domain-containing protein, partial [Balneolaceae bacterium]|nr:T9SS type A sorting domain-containing protein [Balneolaceae bacterium]